jgi:hypothetical protein
MARICAKLRSNHIAALVIGLSAAHSVKAHAAEVLIDRVLGSVDGQPFLYSEVAAKVQSGPLVVVSEYPATEQSTPFEKALQDTINFQLIIINKNWTIIGNDC